MLRPSEDLLKALSRLAWTRFPQACRSGGCGICKVQVLDGLVRPLGPQSRTHISEQEEAEGMVLACRCTPCSPVHIEVIGKIRRFLVKDQ